MQARWPSPHVAGRSPGRRLAFTVADLLWVAVSAIVLVLFWPELTGVARFLIIAVALVVEVLATLQFRAAGGASGGVTQMA